MSPADGEGAERILGVDFGERRIGLSVSDPVGITAQPAGTLERRSPEEAVEDIRSLAAERGAGRIVVGLPLNMNGSEGPAARAARGFAESLRRGVGLPVVLWDERLTTAEGESLMRSAGLSRRKRAGRRDGIAAQLILQSYLDSRPAGRAR